MSEKIRNAFSRVKSDIDSLSSRIDTFQMSNGNIENEISAIHKKKQDILLEIKAVSTRQQNIERELAFLKDNLFRGLAEIKDDSTAQKKDVEKRFSRLESDVASGVKSLAGPMKDISRKIENLHKPKKGLFSKLVDSLSDQK